MRTVIWADAVRIRASNFINIGLFGAEKEKDINFRFCKCSIKIRYLETEMKQRNYG